MPQITLECSDNIVEKNLPEVLITIHEILTAQLPTAIDSCKSRIIRHKV